jgi:hypothetical protein
MSLPTDKTLTVTTTVPIVAYNDNQIRSIVREPTSGKIWLVTDFPIRVRYSTDGINWTLLSDTFAAAYASSPNLFLDGSENLLLTYLTSDSVCTVYKRDKDTGVWTTYTVSTIAQVIAGTFRFDVCQGSDGTLHFVRTILTYFAFPTNQSKGLAYWSFLDGVFTTPRMIVSYGVPDSGGNQEYGIDTNSQNSRIGIVVHSGNILVFWTKRKTLLGVTTFTPKYGVLGSGPIDVVDAATAWLTAKAYKKYWYVLQAGSYYSCLVAHTSGVFATDLAAGKWSLISTYTTPTVLFTESTTSRCFWYPRTNGKLYYMIRTAAGYYTGTLYENHVNITPMGTDQWGNWLYLEKFEVASNGDIMVYGADARLLNSPGSFVIRYHGTWYSEHTPYVWNSNFGVNNAGSHTYNMRKFR